MFQHSIYLIAAGWLIASCVLAQQNVTSISFDAASIKPDPVQPRFFGGRCRGTDSRAPGGNPASNVPLGRCVLRWMTLKQMIGLATSDPRGLRLQGGPTWIGSDHFDVDAAAENPGSVGEATLTQMLMNLLRERFKLQSHHEQREMDGLALVLAKGGPKFSSSAYAGNDKDTFATVAGVLVGNAVSMRSLAEELFFWLRKPVTDETGLSGVYDVRLRWIPQDGEIPLPPPLAPPGGSAARSTASSEFEPPAMPVAVRE